MEELRFDSECAMNSDAGGLIEESGNYRGEITKAEVHEGNENSKYITFGFKTVDDLKTDFINVYTKKKNGERSFGFNIIQSLMGLLSLKSVSVVSRDDIHVIPQLLAQKIAFGLQKEYYMSSSGSIKWKMILVRFYDVESQKSYNEMITDSPPKKWEIKIKDKNVHLIENYNNSDNFNNSNNDNFKNEDLPF